MIVGGVYFPILLLVTWRYDLLCPLELNISDSVSVSERGLKRNQLFCLLYPTFATHQKKTTIQVATGSERTCCMWNRLSPKSVFLTIKITVTPMFQTSSQWAGRVHEPFINISVCWY